MDVVVHFRAIHTQQLGNLVVGPTETMDEKHARALIGRKNGQHLQRVVQLRIFVDKIGKPARESCPLRPALVAPRFRLGHPIEEAERVRHSQHSVLVLPGVFLDFAADVATDFDTPLGPQNRQETSTDQVDQLIERLWSRAVDVHHSPKTPDTPKVFQRFFVASLGVMSAALLRRVSGR